MQPDRTSDLWVCDSQILEEFSAMASNQSGVTCGSCSKCDRDPSKKYGIDSHHDHFEAVSLSPEDGINFNVDTYTGMQIANAFAGYMPDYMEWPIKKNAIDRWSDILAELPEPLIHPATFDLQPIFSVFDDLLFLGALQGFCRVKWVDRAKNARYLMGTTTGDKTIQGPTTWIQLVRLEEGAIYSVDRYLGTLLHEMCHALEWTTCGCDICICEVNELSAYGVSGHGPAFQRLRITAEETVNRHLRMRSHIRIPGARREEKAATKKLLHGLYLKITRKNTPAERAKISERGQKRLEGSKNTQEEYFAGLRIDESLDYMTRMFRELNPQE